jgi:hypothetical protein
VNEDEMGEACGTNGRDEKNAYRFSVNLNGRGHTEDLFVDEKIILEWIL